MKISRKTGVRIGLLLAVATVLVATGTHRRLVQGLNYRMLAWGLRTPRSVHPDVFAPRPFSPDRARELQLVDESGRRVTLPEAMGNRAAFINKWATWCAPCIAEMPGIASLYEASKDTIAFVMLSTDADFEKAKAFKARNGYPFPIYTLAGPEPGYLNSRSIPVTFLVSPQMDTIYRFEGMRDYDMAEFREFLNALGSER